MYQTVRNSAVKGDDMQLEISGQSASEIAESLRRMLERGVLSPGDPLPSVRALAETLSVNRNTVVAAYGELTRSGLVVTRGRGGTHVADHAAVAQEGYAGDSVLRDVGTGNPDPARIPNALHALGRLVERPVLYGTPVIDPGFEAWAHTWMSRDLAPAASMRLTITSGAADAVERLLADVLTRGDGVALEDPCFLASIHTVRLGGYRPVAVPVDEEGMTVAGLRTALEQGVRAVLCTPRAQNPTGASLTATRAAELRAVLSDFPYVLVIEDDHFSMLSQVPLHSLIGPDHKRWAFIRSVSKFLGPDMCLAVAASDPDTAERLALRLTPGTTWGSHLLQRLTHAQMTDLDVLTGIADAGAHYRARNTAFAALLTENGVPTTAGDGLNVWVPLPVATRAVTEQLMRRGWLARSGEDFVLTRGDAGATGATGALGHLRMTIHELDDTDAARLAADIADSVQAVQAAQRKVQ